MADDRPGPGPGVPSGWFAADEVYGDNGQLRTRLETAQARYVLAVFCTHRVPAGPGRTIRADELAARLPRQAWQWLFADQGAKGHRYYDWAWATIGSSTSGSRWLLIRRHVRTGHLAFYRCYAPGPVTLAALVKIAGLRWTIEENFQASKGDAPVLVIFDASYDLTRLAYLLTVLPAQMLGGCAATG